MVAIDRRLGRRIIAVLAGAVVGAIAVVLALFITRLVIPSSYSVSVMFYADETLRTPDQHRRALDAQLRQPGFLQGVVVAAEVKVDTAGELARTLTVRPSTSSQLFTQMVAIGHDPVELQRAANALADAVVAARTKNMTRRRNMRLTVLENRSKELTSQRAMAENALADATLPKWARTGSLVLGALDAQRYAIDLDLELKLARAQDVMAVRDDVDQTIAQLELEMGGAGNVDAQVFSAARLMASLDERQSNLIRARQQVRDKFSSTHDLQVINRALVAKMKPPARRTLWGALLGAALGALFSLVRGMGRPAQTRHRAGPTLETHIHVNVIGSISGAITDYGERKLRPLAQTHPSHLAVDGVRSLQTALDVLAFAQERDGPVIVASADDTNNAGHVVSNLAILAADRGERVLIIETARRNSTLSMLFKTGTQTTLSTTVGDDEPTDQDNASRSGGRVRFMVADEVDASEPPVPGAFIGYFSRIYIRADSIERATQLMRVYDKALGILIGADSIPISKWQAARDSWLDESVPLDGLVHCGHQIDDRAYAPDDTI